MLHADAAIPLELVHPAFVATPLTTDLVALDYAAYMASPEVIRVHSDGRWPIEEFTLEQDRELIAQHQADHEARRAFTFLLLNPTRSAAVGCLYLNPVGEYFRRVGADAPTLSAYPAMVTFWIRQDLRSTGLVDAVVGAVHSWLLHEWPLRTFVFRVLPGEVSSRSALERSGLGKVRIELPGEPRPYLWFRSGTRN